MFRVLENGNPARYPECNVHPSWDTCDYNTLPEATAYAMHWLGWDVKGDSDQIATPIALTKVGVRYDYSGYGDTIEIVEIESFGDI